MASYLEASIHRLSFMIMSFTVGLHSNLPVKSFPHPWGGKEGGGALSAHLLRLLFDRFGLALPLETNSPSLFLIHSLLACCCSVSIEAQLNASVSESKGFFFFNCHRY